MDPVGTETVFGRSIKIYGELHGSEDVLIEGDFEGVIRLGGATLTIGQDARVRANIAARNVVVYGKVEGEIRATGFVSLISHAVVLADIFAVRFSMEEGAALRGYIDPVRASEPVPEVHEVWSPEVGEGTSDSGVEQEYSESLEVPRLFEVHTPFTERATPMPAGLAAAARHFREVASSSSAEFSGKDQTSEGSSELTEKQA